LCIYLFWMCCPAFSICYLFVSLKSKVSIESGLQSRPRIEIRKASGGCSCFFNLFRFTGILCFESGASNYIYLYHHCLIFDETGDWTVIQQGMDNTYARRYQWLSEGVQSFVDEPHTGIASDAIKPHVLDMTARQSAHAQEVSLDIIRDNPEHLRKYFGKRNQTRISDFTGKRVDELTLPPRHPIIDMDISEKGMKVLKEVYELQPASYEELISLNGL
jgi:hypothetical protein